VRGGSGRLHFTRFDFRKRSAEFSNRQGKLDHQRIGRAVEQPRRDDRSDADVRQSVAHRVAVHSTAPRYWRHGGTRVLECAQRIVLASRPQGKVTETDFRLELTEAPRPEPGQLLLRTQYLSLDPYMRWRMDDAKSYAAATAIGEVMPGESIAEVADSRHPEYAKGDIVLVDYDAKRNGFKQSGFARLFQAL